MKRTGFVLVLCILIYLSFVLFSISEPPMGDSAAFLIAAKVFLNKALQTSFVNHLDIRLGIWHPPFYIHILQLIDKAAGLNLITARLFGISCFIITLFLIFLIIVKINEASPFKHIIGLTGVFLYSINPMAIQGSLLIDIDNTIMPVLLLSFCYLFIKRESNRGSIVLGFLFGILLWAKLTTSLFLIPSILIYYVLKGKYKEGFKKSILVFSLGAVCFLTTWYLYSLIMNKPFMRPFSAIIGSFMGNNFVSDPLSAGRNPWDIIRTLARVILYVSVFNFIILVIAYMNRIKEYFQKKEIKTNDYLLILNAMIFFVYLFVGGLLIAIPSITIRLSLYR